MQARGQKNQSSLFLNVLDKDNFIWYSLLFYLPWNGNCRHFDKCIEKLFCFSLTTVKCLHIREHKHRSDLICSEKTSRKHLLSQQQQNSTSVLQSSISTVWEDPESIWLPAVWPRASLSVSGPTSPLPCIYSKTSLDGFCPVPSLTGLIMEQEQQGLLTWKVEGKKTCQQDIRCCWFPSNYRWRKACMLRPARITKKEAQMARTLRYTRPLWELGSTPIKPSLMHIQV